MSPIDSIYFSNKIPQEKRYRILIGNSKNDFNNHFDILDITKDRDNKDSRIPLSYGANSHYSKKIKELALEYRVQVLEKFLPLKSYNWLLSECKALVINSHRQMAIGNLWIALEKGIKIYLNKKNLVYKILKNNNVKVFTIEDFKKDILTNNLSISMSIAKSNISNFNAIYKNSKIKFVQTISKINNGNN